MPKQTTLGRGRDYRGWSVGKSLCSTSISYQDTLLSNGKRVFQKKVKETLSLQTHQFLLDLLCTSMELHIILMSQKASKNEQNMGRL